MRIFCFLILLIAFSSKGLADQSTRNKADELYGQGKKEEAKALYLSAAGEGDTVANFDLASKYSIDSIKNYKIAALAGHRDALKEYIDKVFYRAETFRNADPISALSVYRSAKKVNPGVRLYDEKRTVETLEKCEEAGALDFSSLKDRYPVNIDDSPWKWARIVSNSEDNPRMVLQLICSGGVVPLELQAAVKNYYKSWKEGRSVKFNGCDYAQANFTIAVCSRGELY